MPMKEYFLSFMSSATTPVVPQPQKEYNIVPSSGQDMSKDCLTSSAEKPGLRPSWVQVSGGVSL